MNSSGSAVLPLALLLSLHLSCHALSPAKDTFGNECTSNADCAPEKFCNLSIPGPKKCVLRPGVGKKCKPDGGDCLKGLFCLKTPAVPTPECRPRVVFGGRCWVGLKNNCAVKLECIPTSGGFGKCGFPVKGPQPRLLLGQKCHYPLQEGCQIPNFFSPPHFIPTESQNPEVGFHRPDLPECLAIQGRIEFALPGSILRRPGAACNPKKDMCDDDLYLRCEPYGKRFVCMQRGYLGSACTPGSPFSSCSTASVGTELECRRRWSGYRFDFGTFCERITEYVPQGKICNSAEYVRCQKGWQCSEVPDVVIEKEPGVPTPPNTRYCVRKVGAGGDCSDKFRTKCAQGLNCINKTCRNQFLPPPRNKPGLFGGLGSYCANIPCVSGLKCSSGTRRICRLPEVIAQLWQECSSRATKAFKCVKGYDCTRGFEWVGIKRCRPIGGVGAYCESNVGCRGSLKCAPGKFEDGLRKRTCYDPAKALPRGSRCDPKDDRCVIRKEPRDEYGEDGEHARCFRIDGNTPYRCF